MKFVTIVCMMIISLNVFSLDVSGNQTGTWTPDNNPHIMVGDVTVPAGDSLLVEPGVVLTAQSGTRLNVYGKLIAVGTETDSIRFTGIDGGLWEGIRLDTPDQSQFKYCRISDTDGLNDYGINAVQSPVLIENSLLDNHRKAVNFSAVGTTEEPEMIIRHSKVMNCTQHGILVTDNSNVLIESCEVTQCGLGPQYRGAIQLSLQSSSSNCSPTIIDNWIHNNGKQGITMANLFNYEEMAPHVENNLVEYNLTGIYLFNAKGYYRNNVIRHNFIENDPDSGAGVMLYGSGANGTFYQNEIYGNFTAFYLANDATANLGNLDNPHPDGCGINHMHDNVSWDGALNSVVNHSAMDVMAQNNIWDSEDYDEIAATITDGNDNPAYGFVIFDPIYSETDGVLEGVVELQGEIGTVTEVTIAAGDSITYPDETGHYSLTLPEGNWDVSASHPWYEEYLAPDIEIISGETTILDIELLPTHGILEGEVILTGGDGNITETFIEIGAESINPDEDGFFEIVLPADIYELTASLSLYQTFVIEELEILAGEIAFVEIELEPIILPTPENLNVECTEDEAHFSWDEPANIPDEIELLHYAVFLDNLNEPIDTTEDTSYIFTDLISGEVYVAGLAAVYDVGDSEIETVEFEFTGTDADDPLISSTKLIGNYPNPFNPETMISYSLSSEEYVMIEIYNTRGQLVNTLVDQFQEPGYHTVIWDGNNNRNHPVTSGIYLARLRAGKYSSTQKMILLK